MKLSFVVVLVVDVVIGFADVARCLCCCRSCGRGYWCVVVAVVVGGGCCCCR